MEIVIPRPTEEVGRPDLRAMILSVVDKYGNGGEGSAGRDERKGNKTGVVASGPDGMNRLVRNTCAELVGEGRDVEVVVEKFGW